MNSEIAKSYLTTIFGILAGLPTIVLGVFTPGSSLALPATWTHILMIVGGVGLVGLGVVSKAFNVHSTQAQVATSTQVAAVEAKKP
jgi:hypothetical protein